MYKLYLSICINSKLLIKNKINVRTIKHHFWRICASSYFLCFYSCYTNNVSITVHNYFLCILRSWIFSLGDFFRGDFSGGIFSSGDFFRGDLFPRGIFSSGDYFGGDFFRGDFFLGGFFPRGDFFLWGIFSGYRIRQ